MSTDGPQCSVRINEQNKREIKHHIDAFDLKKIRQLLTNPRGGCDPRILLDHIDHNRGYNAFHLAVSEGFADGVLYFLKHHCPGVPNSSIYIDINSPTINGETALHIAVEKGLTVLVESLIEVEGIDLNVASSLHGETPLHIATKLIDIDNLRLLIDAGANVNVKTNEGNTPLHLAVSTNNCDIVGELLKSGCDPKAKNNRGLTPLSLAMKIINNPKITNLLVNFKQSRQPGAVPTTGNVRNTPVRRTIPAVGTPKVSRNGINVSNSFRGRRGQPIALSNTPKFIESTPTFNTASSPIKPEQSEIEKGRHPSLEVRQVTYISQAKSKDVSQLSRSSEFLNKDHEKQYPSPMTTEPENMQNRRANLKSACCQADLQSPPIVHCAETERVVQPSRKLTDSDRRGSILDPQTYYKMTARPRGICLIFSNQSYFHKDFRDRNGSDFDERRLEQMFTNFGYIVKMHKNMTAREIFWNVNSIARDTDHNPYDSFVCAIMSHGTMGTIFGIDGKEFRISEIMISLNATNCPSLAGKPKMFFIQACRGDVYPSGLDMSSNVEEHDATHGRQVIFPDHADFLIGYATVAGYLAQRNTQNGSIYIQTLCKYLEEYAYTSDVLSILTKVTNAVSSKILTSQEGFPYVQVPEVRFTLSKKIRFA